MAHDPRFLAALQLDALLLLLGDLLTFHVYGPVVYVGLVDFVGGRAGVGVLYPAERVDGEVRGLHQEAVVHGGEREAVEIAVFLLLTTCHTYDVVPGVDLLPVAVSFPGEDGRVPLPEVGAAALLDVDGRVFEERFGGLVGRDGDDENVLAQVGFADLLQIGDDGVQAVAAYVGVDDGDLVPGLDQFG